LKKVLFILVILFLSVQLSAQQKEVVDFVDFNFDMDSTTYGSFTEKKISFEKFADFNNDQWLTGGTYSVDIYIDSTAGQIAGTDPANLGDTDSFFVYVKKHAPGTNTAVSNDSTFLTPNSSSTGFDFALKKWYSYEFDLPRTTGYSLFFRRNCDVGAFNVRVIPIR